MQEEAMEQQSNEVKTKQDQNEDCLRSENTASSDVRQSRDNDTADKEDSEELLCGLGSCKPSCLQIFNNPKAVLVWLCLFTFGQGFFINGIININTVTVERRFELRSSQAGMIPSSYDISAAILSIPISYYGAHAHKPRMLTLAALVVACGSFIMSVPHFGTGLYDPKGSTSIGCVVGANSTLSCDQTISGLSRWLGVFIVGTILSGVGGTTLYSVGVVFLDNSVSTRSFPLYYAFFSCASTLGPAFGYLLGGYLVSSVYVDFDVLDSDSIEVSPGDPRFVGAWWLGYLISGALLVIVTLLLMCYARELPAARKAKLERKVEVHQSTGNEIASQEGFGTKWRHLPMALKILVTNPVYMCLNICGACDGLVIAGLGTFLPKFIQNQFALNAIYANMLAGALSIVGAAGGQFFGGVVCRVSKMKVTGMLKFNICVSVTGILLSIIFLCRCSEPVFAGVNANYENTTEPMSNINLYSTCNSQCGCTTSRYLPVCGSNNVQYFSPCHAGCQITLINSNIAFVNCSCVKEADEEQEAKARFGVCGVDCKLLYVFLPLCFLAIFLLFFIIVPSMTVTIRCLPESQRTFGIGVQWVFIRVLGSIPGPILMGFIFDSTCDVWQETCTGTGSCWIYDHFSLSVRVVILCVVLKSISTFSFFLALKLYKPPPSQEQGQANSTPESRKPDADSKDSGVNFNDDSSTVDKSGHNDDKIDEATYL